MPNSIEIKICGLSNRESIDAAIRGGATHIGMIFFDKSPRNVTLEQARILSEHASDMVKKVAVTVDANDEELEQIVHHMAPNALQLHGSETPQRVSELSNRFNLPVIKAISVRSAKDIKKMTDYSQSARRILFDAKPPKNAKLPGGNGVSFDWKILKKSKLLKDNGSFAKPYMLSGGLDGKNVVEALEISGAKAIDISSGVESLPGVKDLEKIQKFLAVVAEYQIRQLAK